MSEAIEIRNHFEELQRKYQRYLPKVDPGLIDDLLLRQMENPGVLPIYMIEVFTKPGLDTNEVREYILSKTGMSPAIYDEGTHYVTNQKLSLEMLKEISDSDDVIEVTGEYTAHIGGYGASHEHRDHSRRVERMLAARAAPSEGYAQAASLEQMKEKELKRRDETRAGGGKSGGYRLAIYTAAGIVGAILLAGFVISGGLLPNTNVNQAIPGGSEPGLLHGYVGGPGGLPAVGATVLAVQQGSDFSASAFVSLNGQYSLDLPPGEYIVVVAYPDGTDKAVFGLNVERGSDRELDFSY